MSSISLQFTPKKVAFGRHETFALRYSWLTKGFQAFLKDKTIFSSPEATVTLGVGKNMVNSIRYWLLASRLIEKKDEGLETTDLGQLIFGEDGYDPYLEDEATIWMIHWLISSNPQVATAWYWFFKHFHKSEFTSQEVTNSLADFLSQNIQNKVALGTIKQDMAVLLRMYHRSKGSPRTPVEEALDSPLSLLNLISQAPDGRIYHSQPAERKELPIGIFGFAIAELFCSGGISDLPIEELLYSKSPFPSPGSVFRLTENALITKLEQLILWKPGIFELSETAGIHQLYLTEAINPLKFLEFHYREYLQAEAA